MDSIAYIIMQIALLVAMWEIYRFSKENKQLQQRVDILQQQLIEALNKDVKNQDNFSTDPVQ